MPKIQYQMNGFYRFQKDLNFEAASISVVLVTIFSAKLLMLVTNRTILSIKIALNQIVLR